MIIRHSNTAARINVLCRSMSIPPSEVVAGEYFLLNFLPNTTNQSRSEKEHGGGFGGSRQDYFFLPLVTMVTESVPVMFTPS